MVGHGLSPAWKKSSLGTQGADQNKVTCDHLFNSRAMMTYASLTNDETWNENPAYIPFSNQWTGGSTLLTRDATDRWAFMHWLTPARMTHASLYIGSNSINASFKVYLGENGPSTSGTFTGGVNKKFTVFDVPSTSEPEYVKQFTWEGTDPINEFMASGHSYSYVFELDDPVPSLPISTIDFTMSTRFEFGSGGL